MKPVLVTGAEGFIGSHLVERLLRDGYRVRATALYDFQDRRGWLETIPKSSQLEIVVGDLRDHGFAKEALRGCDRVVHLAAQISIPYSYENPEAFFQTNTLGLLYLLQAAQAEGVQQFVHTSTSEVYGTAKQIPMDENHPLNPQSPYAASKAAADHLALSFFYSYGMPVTVVRPFNTFGPRQSLRAIIPTVLYQLVHSDRLHVGHLHPTRDFLFVDDLVEAYVLALAGGARISGQIFHFGTGIETSIADLIHLCEQVAGRSVPIETSMERERPKQSEVDRLVCASLKAKERLGWSPKVDLKTGLKTTLDWISEQPRLEASRFRR